MTTPNPAHTANQNVGDAPSEVAIASKSSSTSSDAGGIDLLVTLLQQQIDRYKKLHDLSGQQARLVKDGHPEQLLGVLAQRQQLVDELTQINSDLKPYRSRWDQLFNTLNEQDKERVRRLVGEVDFLLSGIIEQDNRDREQLEEAKNLIAGELGQTAQASAAVSAYKVQSAAGKNHFTDRQG